MIGTLPKQINHLRQDVLSALFTGIVKDVRFLPFILTSDILNYPHNIYS